METKQTHFKMYKSGRKWVFACALVLALGGTATVAHADTASSSEEPESSQVTTKTSSTDTSETAATNDGATKGTTSGDNQSEGTTDDQNQPDLTTDDQGDSNQEEMNEQATANSDQATDSEVSNEGQDKNAGDSDQVTNDEDSAKGDKTDATTNDEAPAEKIQAESLKLAADPATNSDNSNSADTLAANASVTTQTPVTTANDAVQDGGSVYDDFPNAEYNILGIPSYFHIFANEATLQTHTNGNIAVGLLHANVNFGTNIIEALLDKDISYIQDFDKLASSSFVTQDETRDNKIVFGDGVEIDISDPSHPKVNNVEVGHLTAGEIFQDKNGNVYIDFAKEFAKLKQTNAEVADWPSVKDYTSADFPDENNRVIDVTGMTPDENGRIVLNLSSEVLNADRPLTIKGLDPDENGNTVIINVDTNGQDDYHMKSQIKIVYSDGSERAPHETEYFGDNHLLWNFIDRTASDKQYSGNLIFDNTFQGSVLAPSADVTINHNLDGNIIADKVTVASGETHRWDLQDRPYPGKPELPENPDIPVTLPGEAPEPAPEPEEPEPETPGTEGPGTEEPEPETPGTEEPGTEEPEPETPGTEEPEPEKPGTEEPEKPGTETPGTEEPNVEEPEAPEVEEPSIEETDEAEAEEETYEHQYAPEAEEFEEELGEADTIAEEEALLDRIDTAIAQAKANHQTTLVAQLEAVRAQLLAKMGYGNGTGLPQTSEAHSSWAQLLGLALAGTTLGAWLLRKNREH
ncbi:collagen-binding domain-containing protein [Levilactobacillus namurensis]|uniref:collagen-binding domain-containing protein n=1 Tax=Levilactobacillus namurensis TaxID=380393 RepID=UPI001D7D0D5D|nr:collagen-binding domain-containing protein [Levilactobacillus namurensis]HJE45849.1 KxYKxGKxW signal peptide domain-containing protein [Levilactobacillus namurensis]